MTDNFSNMRNFLHVYFGMDYDIFGNNTDEIVKCFIYDVYEDDFNGVIKEFTNYLKNHYNDLDDVFLKNI